MTLFRIAHACGHISDHDHGAQSPDKRPCLARWLTERPCSVIAPSSPLVRA